jgi:predicted ArsR family transcriptional regulator
MDTGRIEQKTRQSILDHLKEHGPATVDELVRVLGLNSVTVRHHLDILRGEELIADPEVRHRNKPGRPQYVYGLSDKSSTRFPKNYCELAAKLLEEVKSSAAPGSVNVIFDGVAKRLAATAPRCAGDEPLAERLDRAVAFLDDHGYVAGWEKSGEGFLLHTCNCPYEALAKENPELCAMDLTLAASLLGGSVERVSRVLDGASSCSYRLAATGEAAGEPAGAEPDGAEPAPELKRTQSS